MIRNTMLGAVLAVAAASALAGTLPAQKGAANNATYGKPSGGQVIFDQGPSTGSNGGCWSNSTASQNFSDLAPLAAGTAITGLITFTCIPPTTGTVTFQGGRRGPAHAFQYTESGTPTSWVSDGAGGYIVTYDLVTPFVVPSGLTMGYGLSGDGFELGQNSVLTPGDGFMSQYDGQSYAFPAGVGDQMFQLLGGSQCDVNADGKYNARDLVDYAKTCRKDGGSEKQCVIALAKFVKACGVPKR